MSEPRPLKKLTVVDQVLQRLRHGIVTKEWVGLMPGTPALAARWDVSIDTIHKAFKVLEKEGLVVAKGSGRRREIARDVPGPDPSARPLRVGLMSYEDSGRDAMSAQVLLAKFAAAIESEGHTAFVSEKSMLALHLDAERIRKMTTTSGADAWVAVSAPKEVLRLLASGPVPAFAVGGVPDPEFPMPSTGVPVAPSVGECVRRLTALGHRQIVLICPPYWRNPETSSVRIFREELVAAGITPGAYNVPDWDYGAEGFRVLLTMLFAVTPPTALIVEDSRQAVAVQAFLAARGLRIPADVSLVTVRADATLDWATPRFARFERDEDKLLIHVIRWLKDCSKGRINVARIAIPATFDPGGTVGPAPGFARV